MGWQDHGRSVPMPALHTLQDRLHHLQIFLTAVTSVVFQAWRQEQNATCNGHVSFVKLMLAGLQSHSMHNVQSTMPHVMVL